MRCSWIRSCAPFRLAALAVFVALGCGQPVREDRSINWSRGGEAVGFQHGREGVFIADKKGDKLTKIFEPAADVLATSTPLWSPDGRRAIFTTARPATKQQGVTFSIVQNDDPAGNIHFQCDIVYTCWMYEKTSADQREKPVELFTASCNHVGYVAANLAVRWHPREDRIHFINQAEGRHGVFEYDLKSRQTRRLFPHLSQALIFDWTPDGSHLVCLLGNSPPNEAIDGIWIGQPGNERSWWHVPRSGRLATSDIDSLLERLRASRPAWTSDGARFAFCSTEPGSKDGRRPEPADRQVLKEPPIHSLRLGTLATRETRVIQEGAEPYRDLHWRPDGQEIGVIRGVGDAPLLFVRPGEGNAPVVANHRPTRRFVGWNATNDRWAYVAPASIPPTGDDTWALLLVADPQARDAVLTGEPGQPEREVFAGMKVTFPQWSPQEDKLSLWVTFSPAYRSLPSILFQWGLRPGDPAAIFDMKTRELSWMAINSQEKLQVGHYYLLKRDYAAAWKWYEEANRDPAPLKTAPPRNFDEYLEQATGPRNSRFFEYFCLTKLNRPAAARAKLDEFERTFLPNFPADSSAGADARRLHTLIDPDSLIVALLRDSYIAEVFLSLDAAADAEEFFRRSLTAATSDSTRFSKAIILAQILLLERKYSEYADLATQRIGPELASVATTRVSDTSNTIIDLRPWIELVARLSLAPLFDGEFQSALAPRQVRGMIGPWQRLRQTAVSDDSRLNADMVLQAIYRRLDMSKQQREVADRIRSSPRGSQQIFGDTDFHKLRRDILSLLPR